MFRKGSACGVDPAIARRAVRGRGYPACAWVNAAANKVVRTIRVGNVPAAIASGPSGVWVANRGDGTVDRISPATGTVTRRNIQVEAGPDGIAVGPHAVWVANGLDGTVTRIDPATGQPSGPVFVGAGPAGIALMSEAAGLTVFIADYYNGLVRAVGPDGIVRNVSDEGRVVFGAPTRVAFAAKKRWLYVADSSEDKLVVLNIPMNAPTLIPPRPLAPLRLRKGG